MIKNPFSKSTNLLWLCLLFALCNQAQADTELLQNGDFSQGVKPWILQCTKEAKATMDIVSVDGQPSALHINVTEPSETRYYIQVIQKNVKLSAGKTYRLHFRSRSEPDSQIAIVFIAGRQPMKPHWKLDNIAVEKEWKEYSYDFRAPADDDSAVLALTGLAKQTGDYYFSDISLTEVEQ